MKSAATVKIVRRKHVAGKRQDRTDKEQEGAEGHFVETLALKHHESSDFGAMQHEPANVRYVCGMRVICSIDFLKQTWAEGKRSDFVYDDFFEIRVRWVE